MKLKDKVAVITGAASGIGKEIARTFVREGAKVVIADKTGANTVAAELADDGRALGVAMDVTDEAQVEAGMATATNVFGRIDILISNAGVQTVAPLDQFEFAKWRQLLSIHLDGAFLCRNHVRKTAIHMRTLVEAAAAKHDALFLHPLVHHAR